MKSWKTTLAGCLSAAAYAAASYASGGAFVLKDLIIAVGVAALGFLAKDLDVTGGTK